MTHGKCSKQDINSGDSRSESSLARSELWVEQHLIGTHDQNRLHSFGAICRLTDNSKQGSICSTWVNCIAIGNASNAGKGTNHELIAMFNLPPSTLLEFIAMMGMRLPSKRPSESLCMYPYLAQNSSLEKRDFQK